MNANNNRAVKAYLCNLTHSSKWGFLHVLRQKNKFLKAAEEKLYQTTSFSIQELTASFSLCLLSDTWMN